MILLGEIPEDLAPLHERMSVAIQSTAIHCKALASGDDAALQRVMLNEQKTLSEWEVESNEGNEAIRVL